MKNDILSLFYKYFNEHHFNIVLSNNFSISSLFRYKDKLNKGMTADTVYKWSCPNCRVHYIGSSTRNLYVRAAEHAGVSFRTGQHLSHQRWLRCCPSLLRRCIQHLLRRCCPSSNFFVKNIDLYFKVYFCNIFTLNASLMFTQI